jgi:hypothetical protein
LGWQTILDMDISLNNKIIIFFLIVLFALSTAKAFGISNCNDDSAQSICVQVIVKSKAAQALADMVVYLAPLDGQVLDKSSKETKIGQRGKSFNPYISVSQVNSKINFVNQDDITHHIYSAGSDNKFSFKIRAGQTNASTQFNHASEVAMGCNIHDWMSGYLLVVNTPYFGKTDKHGQVSFDITELGRYQIVVWHPQLQNENNRLSKEAIVATNSTIIFALEHEMAEIPLQESDDDFDFLSDYE